MIALYHQTKTLINFWCRRRLNPKSLIQPSKTLLVELLNYFDGSMNWLICHLLWYTTNFVHIFYRFNFLSRLLCTSYEWFKKKKKIHCLLWPILLIVDFIKEQYYQQNKEKKRKGELRLWVIIGRLFIFLFIFLNVLLWFYEIPFINY